MSGREPGTATAGAAGSAGRKGRTQRGEGGAPARARGWVGKAASRARPPGPPVPPSFPALPARASLPVSAAPSRRQRSPRPRHVPAGPEARRLPAAPARCSGPPHPGGEWHSCRSRSAERWEDPGPRAASSGRSLPGLLPRALHPGPGKDPGLSACGRTGGRGGRDSRARAKRAGRGASRIGAGPCQEKLFSET